MIYKDSLYAFSFFLLTLLISLFISQYYISGDQYVYIDFYEASRGLSLAETYILQITALGSGDIGYSLVIWLFSDILEKNFLMSAANAFLAFILFKLLRKNNYPIWFAVGVLLSFYIFVLFFAAERLKFAAIIVVVAFFYKSFFKRSLIILFASLFHAQALFVLALVIIYELTRNNFISNIFKFKNLIAFVFISFTIFIFFILGFEIIVQKFNAYSSYEIFSLAKPTALGLLSIVFMRDKFFAVSSSFFFLLSCFILGTERIVMIQFIFVILFLDHNSKNQIFTLFLLFSYLFLKNIDFIYKIFICGEGFVCMPY
tara:strand:- start:7188 stop:8132 length:945 start_codon:yes stop_codon:yes gene_type:complete